MENKEHPRTEQNIMIEKWWYSLPTHCKDTLIDRWRTDNFYRIYIYETKSFL